jgi:hypothetical protein
MGFFDKVKHFVGGHGVKVAHLDIEKQVPGTVSMPLTDTVVKGHFDISAEKDCEVLSMKAELVMEYPLPDGNTRNVVLGSDVYPEAGYDSRSADMLKYPFALGAGQHQKDFFIIRMEKDIPSALKEHNQSLQSAKFFVKTMVDVKGSPFDPEAKDALTIRA